MRPVRAIGAMVLLLVGSAGAWPAAEQAPGRTGSTATTAAVVSLPPGYVIGADDVLSILFWRESDLSAEVTVRPDGKVALPLLNDVQAAGLTPEQLREHLLIAARKYVEDPNPTVMVKTIRSRTVFITGQVEKPGPYPLTSNVTVLQLIAIAGGLRDFVHGKNISIFRAEDGRQVVHRFNYQDVVNGRNLAQNVDLKPGDTVVVP